MCCLGHGHPAVVGAVRDQAERLMHVSNYFYIEHRGQVAALISKLANDDMAGARLLAQAMVDGDEAEGVLQAAALVPGEQVWETFFANSGAEANEGSMKLARLYAKRAGNGGNTIVCLRGGFTAARWRPSRPPCRIGCRRALRRCRAVLRPARRMTLTSCGRFSTPWAGEICAVMLEPIQGGERRASADG